MKCSGENEILRGIFHVVSRFPLHIMLDSGNLYYFLDSVLRALRVSRCNGIFLDSEPDMHVQKKIKVASAAAVTGSDFMLRFRLFLAQCMFIILQWIGTMDLW